MRGKGERRNRRFPRGEADEAALKPGMSNQHKQVPPSRSARKAPKTRGRKEGADLRIVNQDDERVGADVRCEALCGRESPRRVREGDGELKSISGHAYPGSSITTAVQLWKPPN